MWEHHKVWSQRRRVTFGSKNDPNDDLFCSFPQIPRLVPSPSKVLSQREAESGAWLLAAVAVAVELSSARQPAPR